jgi:hypothetical protein
MRCGLAVIIFLSSVELVTADPGPRQTVSNGPISDMQGPMEQTLAQNNPQPPATTTQAEQGKAANSKVAPGQFEVDEEAADRALERTLIQTGVLLLPLGQVEIEPSFRYTRREQDIPTFVTEGENTFVGTANIRRNIMEANMQFRFGLPFDSQFELQIPYRYVDESRPTKVGLTERNETDDSGHGRGDIRVGLAKTLLREARWWPDLVGRVIWDTDTGETRDNNVVLGDSYNEIIGALSAVKRQDPLAFVGGISYTYTLEKDDVKPGRSINFSIGTVLAASPDTSLSLSVNQSFINELEVDNNSIDGSDQVVGTVTLGASSIIGKNKLLNFSTDIGLTDEAPDYSVRVSLGWRLNIF